MAAAIVVFGIVFLISVASGLILTLAIDKNRRVRRARLVSFGSSQAATAAVPSASPAISNSRTRTASSKIERQLQKSGLAWSVAQLATFAGITAVTIGFALFIFQPDETAFATKAALSVSIGVLLSFLLFALLLRILEARRIAEFRASLPEALETMARSLRAGRAASDAVGLIGTSGDDLLAIEFRRCRADIQHGSTLRTAIEALADRVDILDVHFIASAISLQHQSGGNLAETLDIAALSLRQFRQLEAKSRALSAEVRMSAIILTALPLFVTGGLSILAPEYLLKLVDDPRGRIMTGYAVLSLLGGLFVMKRMEKIDG